MLLIYSFSPRPAFQPRSAIQTVVSTLNFDLSHWSSNSI